MKKTKKSLDPRTIRIIVVGVLLITAIIFILFCIASCERIDESRNEKNFTTTTTTGTRKEYYETDDGDITATELLIEDTTDSLTTSQGISFTETTTVPEEYTTVVPTVTTVPTEYITTSEMETVVPDVVVTAVEITQTEVAETVEKDTEETTRPRETTKPSRTTKLSETTEPSKTTKLSETTNPSETTVPT